MISIPSVNELDYYCRSNREMLKGPVRKVVLLFQGLNRHEYYTQATSDVELILADRNDLMVIPYLDPWNWMNRAATDYTNWLVNEVFRLFNLSDDTEIVSSGYSMGGLAALIYPIYSERPVSACVANSPVCDLEYHFTERKDLPRTLLNAFITDPDGFERGLLNRCAVHQIDRMKRIPYFIIAGDADDQVSKAVHADKLVGLMRERSFDVDYRELHGMRHWRINDYKTWKDMIDFMSL